MADTPSSEMRERLRALCRQITVADEIDPEIQEELMTHVEDRFTGYLHGKDPVTEEDAFLLVREHFGNPAVVKELLQHTHVQEATVSLGRRLAAIAAVSLALSAALKVFTILFTTLLVWVAQGTTPESQIWGYLHTAQNLILLTSLSPILWVVVYRWRRAIDAGQKPWFTRWSPRQIVISLMAIVLIVYMIPSISGSGIDVGISQTDLRATVLASMGLLVAWIALVLQSIAWLWWCDRPPRTKRTLSYTTLTWALVGACGTMPVTVLSIGTDVRAGFLTILKLASIEDNVLWSLRMTELLTALPMMAAWMFIMFIMFILIGYAGRAVYWFAQRISMTRRPSDTLRHDRPEYFPHYD